MRRWNPLIGSIPTLSYHVYWPTVAMGTISRETRSNVSKLETREADRRSKISPKLASRGVGRKGDDDDDEDDDDNDDDDDDTDLDDDDNEEDNDDDDNENDDR